MNKKLKLIIIILISFFIFLSLKIIETDKTSEIIFDKKNTWKNIGINQYEPTIKEKTWIYTLFWEESRGNPSAYNSKDLDGTPSYGIAQFKPETLKEFAIKYKLLPDNLEKVDYINFAYDSDFIFELLSRMMKDKEKISWQKLFPGTIKKIGLPPK